MEQRKKYAVFTMDVEEFTDTECVANSGQTVTCDMLDGLDEYIRLLEKHDIRATLFTVCQTACRHKERLQRYLARGHRIALHGLEHIPPACMDNERFRRDTQQAKALLEQEFSTQITGYRAPCFSLDGSKLDILRMLGFRYDSSRMDFTPARPVEKLDMSEFNEPVKGVFRKNGFYEFGLTCQRFFGKNFPISGGGYVRLGHWSFIMPLISSYVHQNDYYVFYLHPFELSRERPPALKNLKLYDRYYLNSGLRTYRLKIEAIIRLLCGCGYRFVTFDELAEIMENA